MEQRILEQIKKDKMYEYLKQNSYYIKELNRNPNFYKQFKNIIKDKYNLKITDKISNIINDIELVSSIISTLN